MIKLGDLEFRKRRILLDGDKLFAVAIPEESSQKVRKKKKKQSIQME